MSLITTLMTDDHRACDQWLGDAEQAAAEGNWSAVQHATRQFRDALHSHFETEEQVLFPRFESATGMTQGPTRMMRIEHQELRGMLETLLQAALDEDAEEFEGEAETLLIMLQQHNMKEENILYPMCDQHIASAEIEPELRATLKGRHEGVPG